MTELYQTLGEEAATKPLFLGCSVRCPQPQKGPLCAFPPKGPNPGRVLRAARPVLGAAAASCPADKGVQLRFSSCPVTAADLNNIKFSAYRTAMKLRRVQKALRCECGKHGPPAGAPRVEALSEHSLSSAHQRREPTGEALSPWLKSSKFTASGLGWNCCRAGVSQSHQRPKGQSRVTNLRSRQEVTGRGWRSCESDPEQKAGGLAGAGGDPVLTETKGS